MSTQTISAGAIHVIEQFNDAGKIFAGAYRTSAQRVLSDVALRCSSFLGARELPMVGDDVKSRLLEAQEKMTGFLAGRLDIDTSRVVSMIDRVATGATSGIESIAAIAARVDTPLGASALIAFNGVNQPIVDVSMKIADKVVAGAKKLESRAADNDGATAKGKAAKAKPAARRARTSRAVSQV